MSSKKEPEKMLDSWNDPILLRLEAIEKGLSELKEIADLKGSITMTNDQIIRLDSKIITIEKKMSEVISLADRVKALESKSTFEDNLVKAVMTVLRSVPQSQSQQIQASQYAPRPQARQPQGQSQAQQGQNQKPQHELEAELIANQAWLDEACPFSKAQGATWRALAANQAAGILVNNRIQQPRNYLHSIANWKDCHQLTRTKAKLALEIVKPQQPQQPQTPQQSQQNLPDEPPF